MGANAQTSVPLYVAAEVLTAADMNISAGTGVPVFATTVTRDAAFGGAGEKVLAEGQLAYIEASNIVQYYDGAAWATVGPASAGGLTLVSATTIGTTVASVTVSSAFSATYENYKIIVSGGTVSVNDELLGMTLGATATGYYASYVGTVYSANTVTLISNNNASSWTRIGALNTNGINASFELNAPNLAKWTTMTGSHMFAGSSRNYAGLLDNTTSYTAFTLTAGSGTMTGGTIRVYGYSNS